MSTSSSSAVPGKHRRVALAWGVACHLSFAAGVGAMMVSLWTGMRLGLAPFGGTAGAAWDALLLAQFPILHSLLLSKKGRAVLARLAPHGLGAALGTTTFATIASLQLLATFLLWAPISDWKWTAPGLWFYALSALYAASWLLLLKTMADAGLGVQTGYLGWGSVFRGRRPKFGFTPRGSFRWTRQPVYVAFSLTLWTGPVWTVDHFLIATAWTAYCILAPRHKERRYSAQYGEKFAQYRAMVPYWIPRVRPADLTPLHSVAAPAAARTRAEG